MYAKYFLEKLFKEIFKDVAKFELNETALALVQINTINVVSK